jgi:integrase
MTELKHSEPGGHPDLSKRYEVQFQKDCQHHSDTNDLEKAKYYALSLANWNRWKLETPYSQPGDWVFPSFKLKGQQPRVANMLVEDYLRPAAVKVGILSSHRDDEGRLVDDDPRRFGFHNLRHSLASFLVRIRTDPKTVQTLLRHSDVKLTLQCYTHSVSEDRMAAAGAMLTAIFSHAADRGGLKAD